jgi:O-antigen ligase
VRYRLTLGLAAVSCALAPAYTVRWHYGPYPTTLLEHAVAATVVAFVIESYRQRSAPEWRTPFTIPAALFVVAGFIATATAPDLRAAAGLYRAYLLEPIAFAVAVSAAAFTPRRAFAVLCGLGAGGLAVGLPNAVVVLDALARHAYQVTQTPPVVIYLTANAVSLYLDPLVAVAGAYLLFARERLEQLVAAGFLVLALPVEVLTFSRGGYLALLAIALGLALAHPRRVRLLAATAAGVVVVLLIPIVRQRVVLETQNVSGSTASFRIEIWKATLRMLRDRPLFGSGLSGFQARIAPYWNATHPANERFIDPHNILLNFWTETGLLGVVSFAWIFVAGALNSWRAWSSGPLEWRPLQLGFLLALLAILVHGLVDVPYFKNDLSLEFWALLALAWAGSQRVRT